ncbi:unnamed protein product [Blepharisma stoltei]|uniref:Phosphodiesterase n=1 Tax=Blepharisma stoltei TaxID=1481888 RepID=A0AAU9JUV4_9CILI|nr:unnamed protein product [Blepharisma stoltei]
MELSGNGALAGHKNQIGSDLTQIGPPLEITLNQSDINPNTNSSNFKFYLSYAAILILCILSIILSYSDQEINASAFIFGVIILSASLALSTIAFILELKYGSDLLDKWLLINWIYLVSGITIILSDPNTFTVIMQENDCKGYLPSLSAIIVLAIAAQEKMKNKASFIIISSILAFISLFLNMMGNQSTNLTIFQFFCLLIVLGYLILALKEQKNSKVHYLEVAKESQSFAISESDLRTDGVIHGAKKQADTAIEEIVDAINSSIESLSIIKDSKDLKAKEQAVISMSILKSILARLRRSTNIYYTNIENITKGLDEQDKIYFEQTFISKRGGTIYSLPPRQKSLIKLDSIYGVAELQGVLNQIGREWNFNTFFVNDCSGGRPLQTCGYYAIVKYGLKDIFNISEKTLTTFLEVIESRYSNQNPYHNSCHAADVMCSYIYIVFNTFIIEEINSLELLAGIITSIGHDVGHPAKSNRFLIQTMDDLAIQFNDISVLEMHHASIIFKILKENASEIIKSIDPDRWSLVRKMIIEMILSTDLAKHFEIVSHFKAKYLAINEVQDMNDPDFRLDLFKMTIKVADVGHAAKKRDLHAKWCALVIQEFFEQGDVEKSLGIPVSMYCDREVTEIAKTQIGFIKNIVGPLYQTFYMFRPSVSIKEKILVQLEENEVFWMSHNFPNRRQTSIEAPQDENMEEYERLFKSIQHSRRGSLPEQKYLS